MRRRFEKTFSQRTVGGDDDLAIQMRHPQMAPLLIVVNEPDADLVTLALVGQRSQQRPEETVDIGLAHEQIDREPDDVGLNLREAFGAATLGRLPRQRRAQGVRILSVDRWNRRFRHVAAGMFLVHLSILHGASHYRTVCPPGVIARTDETRLVQKSQLRLRRMALPGLLRPLEAGMRPLPDCLCVSCAPDCTS